MGYCYGNILSICPTCHPLFLSRREAVTIWPACDSLKIHNRKHICWEWLSDRCHQDHRKESFDPSIPLLHFYCYVNAFFEQVNLYYFNPNRQSSAWAKNLITQYNSHHIFLKIKLTLFKIIKIPLTLIAPPEVLLCLTSAHRAYKKEKSTHALPRAPTSVGENVLK